MNFADLYGLAEGLLPVAYKAGKAIMPYYQGAVDTITKQDGSPTTLADQAAEEIIITALRDMAPAIPVVAEEATEKQGLPAYAGKMFWLVDPLDGTKEFLRKHPEFTVNIGLILNGSPVLGLIYAPALEVLYCGYADQAFKLEDSGLRQRLQPTAAVSAAGLHLVCSKSHHAPQDHMIRDSHVSVQSQQAVGSSLKFCYIAEGRADMYPRTGRTMEWDTAAGDAIVRATGGEVLTADGQQLLYGKEGFANPGFTVYRNGVRRATGIMYAQ